MRKQIRVIVRAKQQIEKNKMTKAKKKKSQPLNKKSLAIFGAPPIIPGEDSAAYDEILLRATAALKPVDIIDDFLVGDFIRGVWDSIRIRRLQNAQLIAAAYEGLKRVLAPLVIEGQSARRS